MIILGIDPGYATVGYGVVNYDRGRFAPVRFGAITPPPKTDFSARLEMIYDDMTVLLDKSQPQALSIEQLFFSNNKTTAIDVAQARGVILLSARKHGVPVFEYTPMQVKQSVVGYGLAEKKQDSGFIFLNQRGQRITTRGISGELKKFAEKYGIDTKVVYPHSFRHRFAKSFLDRCNDIAFLADLMGHESIETTRIYLRKTATEQREIVDSIIDW